MYMILQGRHVFFKKIFLLENTLKYFFNIDTLNLLKNTKKYQFNIFFNKIHF